MRQNPTFHTIDNNMACPVGLVAFRVNRKLSVCIGRRLVRCWPWDVYSALRVRGRAAHRAGPCQLEGDSQCKQCRVKLGNRACRQGWGTNFFFNPLLNTTTKNKPHRRAGHWLIWHPFYATLPNLESGCLVSCTAETKAPVCTSSDFLQTVLADFKLSKSVFHCISLYFFNCIHCEYLKQLLWL